jgi:hypothetical protein
MTRAGSGFLAVEGELFDGVVVLREVADEFLEVVVLLATEGAVLRVVFLEVDRATDVGALLALLDACAVAARAFPFPEFFATLAVLFVVSVEVFAVRSESVGLPVFLFAASRLDESTDAAEDLSEESIDDAADF